LQLPISAPYPAMKLLSCSLLVTSACVVPEDTKGADDGNPHCWDRLRRCDGPNAHPSSGPGYQPACGLCEGIGGPAWSDKNGDIEIPNCVPVAPAGQVNPEPPRPEWALNNGGKFTVESDRFTMIGKKKDPFCFEFFPSNNSVGDQCYRRQTGKFTVDMSGDQKSLHYDLNIRIPWPSDKFSLFGNISTQITAHGPNMWIVNNLYNAVEQCVCTNPLSSSGDGSHNPDPIFPVMYNWTNHLVYVGREKLTVEYGIGEMTLDHWTYGPHHAWTQIVNNKSIIVRMWQPYNGFEVFAPGSWKDGVADPQAFAGKTPPGECKKGGAKIRIGCDDDGYPTKKNQTVPAAEDLKRARTKVPRSTRKGNTFSDMASRLNSYLKEYENVKECAQWTTEELQRFQTLMLLMKSPELDGHYDAAVDRRAMRGDEKHHGEKWEKLIKLAEHLPEEIQRMQRDGHCHEAVMWFVHHVSEETRHAIASSMPIPMLPYDRHQCPFNPTAHEQQVCDEYLHQVSCQDCHQDATAPSSVVV